MSEILLAYLDRAKADPLGMDPLLRALLRTHGLNWGTLARALGVHHRRLLRWRRYESRPSRSEDWGALARLCDPDEATERRLEQLRAETRTKGHPPASAEVELRASVGRQVRAIARALSGTQAERMDTIGLHVGRSGCSVRRWAREAAAPGAEVREVLRMWAAEVEG